jgi:hypothetical protein
MWHAIKVVCGDRARCMMVRYGGGHGDGHGGGIQSGVDREDDDRLTVTSSH